MMIVRTATPKVSVIVPTYNRAHLLGETIDSVLSQTYRDFEIIVVDDGSDDDTSSMLAPYYGKIEYIKQNNSGVNAARNNAIRKAGGEYIALLDSDDLWAEHKLEVEVAVLDRFQDIGFVYSNFVVIGPQNSQHAYLKNWYTTNNDWGSLFEKSTSLPKTVIAKFPNLATKDPSVFLGNIYHCSLHHPTVLPSASLYRAELARGIIEFNANDSTCGDWEFFAIMSNMYGAAFIDHDLAFNRSHEDSVRLTRIDEKIQLKRRFNLINRLWRQDTKFMLEHGNEVNIVQSSLACEITKLSLFSSQNAEAKEFLREFSNLGISKPGAKFQALKIITYLPGSPLIMNYLRMLKHKLQRMLDTPKTDNNETE